EAGRDRPGDGRGDRRPTGRRAAGHLHRLPLALAGHLRPGGRAAGRPAPPPPWWRRRDGSGGHTIEQTPHVLDTARGLAGEVTDVHAFAARAAEPMARAGETGGPAGSNGARAASNPPPLRPVGRRIGRVADGGAEG